MTGKLYVVAVHVRGGCIYTKVRASRSRRPVKSAYDRHTVACDVCPMRKETLGYIVQQYPKSVHARFERHSNLRSLALRSCSPRVSRAKWNPSSRLSTLSVVLALLSTGPRKMLQPLTPLWSVTCLANWTGPTRLRYPSTINRRFVLGYLIGRRTSNRGCADRTQAAYNIPVVV